MGPARRRRLCLSAFVLALMPMATITLEFIDRDKR